MSFSWFKKNTTGKIDKEINKDNNQEDNKKHGETDATTATKNSYFARLRQGLRKTGSGIATIFNAKKTIDSDVLEELETQLICADVGIDISQQIIAAITAKMQSENTNDIKSLQTQLHDHMLQLLLPYAQPLQTVIKDQQPFVILMIGVNGAGKTTSIGKLAKHFSSQGKKVMLAAGDTFRAAAVEQLQSWGAANNVPVVAQKSGADSASVAYDALQSARAKNADVLIIDTAGRLHTQEHLVEELKKIKRVLQKIDVQAPHETMLVIDACNGQNALRQAQHFHKELGVSAITITKLDGSAKGGIIFAITQSLQLPVRYIGIGEQADDLRAFNAKDFVDALLYED